MPAEPTLQIRTDCVLYGSSRCRLIQRVHQTLVHLAIRGLVDREAQLHEEALYRFQHSLQELLHLIASADPNHID